MTSYVLGLSAYYHDSAAVLLRDGEIVGAVQQERFSRIKHDPGFPGEAIAYCLSEAGVQLADVEAIVFYDKPLIKFERLLETHLACAPWGLKSFLMAMPVWLKEKLYLKSVLRKELAALAELPVKELPTLYFDEHHHAHAASAFYASPYERAAVLCIDGVGEWATTSVWLGDGNSLTAQWEMQFPHSLGLLYSAFTYYTGFKVNSGEYKLMGLAPYGEPRYVDSILEHLLDLKPDGTFRLDMSYFNYSVGLTMTTAKFHDLFDGPPRAAESELTQKEMDIARSIQEVTETIVLRLVATVKDELQVDNLCLAGGVALNCVANGRILRESSLSGVWVQPAAGDAGGALGAAYTYWYDFKDQPRLPQMPDAMLGGYLGPQYSNDEIAGFLDRHNVEYLQLDDDELYGKTAELLAEGLVVGWFQGRMEFGPRALGARSIIGDARNVDMQSRMNLKIKYRESFRPFAPAIMAEHVGEFFLQECASPYMLFVAPVAKEHQYAVSDENQDLFGIDKLKVHRSTIPSVTHVDYTARIQTVHESTNPRFHRLLQAFKTQTGSPVLVNTSFNVRGEPIVESPEDAYRCFMRTEMDYLIMENVVLDKKKQPEFVDDGAWQTEFELD